MTWGQTPIALLALTTVAFLVLSCRGDDDGPASPTATATPTQRAATPTHTATLTPAPTEDVASPTAPPTELAVRPCRDVDLNAGVIGTGGGLGQGRYAAILLGNSSPTSCVLDGSPEVQLIDSQGQVMLTVDRDDFCRASADCPILDPVVLMPGLGQVRPHSPLPGQATIIIEWGNAQPHTALCSEPSEDAAAIRLLLPSNGGQLDVEPRDEYGEPLHIAPCRGEHHGWFYIFEFGPVRE